MAGNNYSVNLKLNADVSGVKSQLDSLQKQLQQISTMKIDINGGNLTQEIQAASEAAMKLSAHLATATNPQTGNLDFTKFYSSIQKSGASLEEYGKALQNMGPAGQKAFVSLADSISKAEIPLKRTNKLIDGMWDNLKKTVGWQISSSMVHGFIGSVQQAVGYAKDLDRSLNDIRIVTGASSDQMAKFAREANKAAKTLSTTTTDYTRASLIYYQQGLGDAEVKQRTEATIKMANATGQSAQIVSDQMTAIWNNFDNGTKSLEYYGDAITALGAKTASSTDEIAEGLQKFASVADTIGLSYEYAASALATITATTRESSSTVGTALRTLFSRLQGLSLGETLDDGTTLNKYSTALMTAGVNIKDATGGLKDMDQILDELGSKWDTLGKDQQVALAQTVAGVRQYTQLVTLMDNWDFFQSNVMTAKTSEGTLEQQAAIYAESWQAASDRVRASWEGLWDTMINSDSMITMLDGLSSIIEAMDTLTASMGGAGGVLTSFLGIATKLFAPKLSQGLRDTAYNVAMLFGGEQKIKEARNTVLDNALKTLDTDGEFGDLYGQNEAEARKAAMKSQIQASLNYAENYNNMTPLQHQIEQQYANASRVQDQRTAEAGAVLDNAKNTQFDARMDTYGSYGSGGEYSSLLERSQSLLADQAFNYMYDELGLDFQNPENQFRINAAQQRAQMIQSSDDDIKIKKTGEVLGNFSSALTDFYKATNETKGPNYLDNLTKAITALETAGYDDKTTKNIIERMREVAAKSIAEGVSVNYDGFYKELIQAQGQAAGGTEFGGLLSAWLERSFNTGMAQANYDVEKKRSEGLRSGREKNLDGTKNIDWADTMVNAGEGALLALSAGQSLTALGESINNGTADAMSSIISIVSMVSQFGMAMASFVAIFKNIAAVASTALGATGWGAIIAGILTLLPAIFQGIDHLYVSAKERAAQEAKTSSELNNAYQQAENRHQNLIKSIDAYGEAQDALTQLTVGTTEWTNSLYEANKAAMSIISTNNLTEGKDYYRDPNGLLKINQSTLNNIEKASETSLDTIEAANRLKQFDNSSAKIVEDNKENLSQELLTEFNNHPIWDILNKQNTGETLSEEEQVTLNSKRLDGNHFIIMDDGSYSQDIISAITTAYLKNSGILDSTDSIYDALAQEGYSGVSDIVVDSIYAIRDSIKASTANIQQQYENEAREFLSDESYSNKDEVMAASGRLLMNEYNKVKENYDNNYKEWAQEYAEVTGLSKLKNFQIGGTDADGNVKYTYTDDNGKIITDQTMDKGAIQQYQIASTTLTNLENSASQLDAIFTSLNAKGDEADGALESYIAEKGFGKATLEEMQALTGALNSQEDKIKAIEQATGLNEEQQKKIAELEGITYETWINGLINNLTKATIDAIPYADRVKTRLGAQATANEDGSIFWDWQGKDNLSNFVDGLNVENLKLLDSTLTNIKAIEGQSGLDSYVDALASLIESADDVDSNSLIQMLLNLENTGSAAGNLQAIQAIIEGLGGSFEGATSAAQAFAAALAGISASGLDGILSKLNQIKNALGDVFSLETGGNIGEDAYNNIIKALPELEGLFTEDIINGGYRYTGSQEAARGAARSAYLATGEDISQMQDWSKTTAQNWNNVEGQNYTMSEWGNFIRSEFNRDNIEATQAGDQGETITSENNSLKMFELLAEGKLGQGALAAVISQQEGIESGADITKTLATYTDNMAIMSELMNTVTSDINGDGIQDYRDLNAADQEAYLNAQDAATAAQAILSNIWFLIEQLADPEGLENAANDFESTKGQTAKDLDDLAEMYNMGEDSDLRAATKAESFGKEGSTIMANSTDMQNYAENLAFMGSQYEYSAEQAALLSEAIANQDWVTAEALMGQTEMATAIAQTAEARGLDAEALAAQTAQISDALTEAGVSAQSIAETAADMLIAQEGLEDLTSAAKDFQSVMNKISTGKAFDVKDVRNLEKMAKAFDKVAGTADLGVKQTDAWNKAFQNFLKKNPKALEEFTKGQGESIKKFQAFQAQMKASETSSKGTNWLENENDALDQLGDTMAKYSDEIDAMEIGEDLTNSFAGGAGAAKELATGFATAAQALMNDGKSFGEAADLMSDAFDFEVVPITAEQAVNLAGEQPILVQHQEEDGDAVTIVTDEGPSMEQFTGGAEGSAQFFKLVKKGGSGGSGGGGGGGGGGGAKEPKKVANKRKSQTVKRYHNTSAKKANNASEKKRAEQRKDVAYGQARIDSLKEINRLTAEQLGLNAKQMREAEKYRLEDKENLIKYGQKYGFNFEFDSEGIVSNYEEIWTQLHDELAALYADNELSEDESKLEESINIKIEELEGALEDYEETLEEIRKLKEEQEELLFEMFENKVEQTMYKVEFEVELDEDSVALLDFMIEALGDSAYKAIDAIDLMNQKAETLYEGIDTYKNAIEEIYALSDDPLHAFAVGSNIDGLLTQDQADALRENRDGLLDYMNQLLEMREQIEGKVLETFDKWTEKIDTNLSTIEHYSTVLNYFKSSLDMLDKSALGVTNQYIRDLESAIIQQSNDSIEANKNYYEALLKNYQEAQYQLDDARRRGDEESVEHWEEVVISTTESMQSAQDAMLSALENTLSLITEQFESAVEDIMDEFYEGIYENGFEGLSSDYELARESADLIAEDYDKIYQLSKLNRQINKTLDDTKIIAGKEKLRKLQQEINDLQKSNVEMSKYELEYLEAEYNLRMAEIELENARNEKDTVRLQKDSEGNWSYVYTQNEEKVNEAQQKYEDALYAMQNMSYEYMEEMSSAVMDTAQQMAEEIAGLRLQDYENEQEYYEAIRKIQDKYAETMALQQAELDKTVANNKQLYDEDWMNYHELTNYKISENERWTDNFAETTLGQLMGSESAEADFAENILNMSDQLAEKLALAAADYFKQIGETLDTYGTSIDDFASHITSSTNSIIKDSENATDSVKDMALDMVASFKEITDEVSNWQQTFGEEIKTMVEEITTLIESINEALDRAAHLQTELGQGKVLDVAGAANELNATGMFGQWSSSGFSGNQDFESYEAKLLEELTSYMSVAERDGQLTDDERTRLDNLIYRYNTFKNIKNRIWSFDTGGYTGEWGSSGRLAMLHEKEIVLNADDTRNFLEALDISRQLIEMIELNAKQSSMGLGEMVASTIKENSQVIEQSVQITAEFPNATDHNEIEEAFNNLINTASQYAFRRD